MPGYFAPKALKAVIVAWTVTDGFPDGPGADPSTWNTVRNPVNGLIKGIKRVTARGCFTPKKPRKNMGPYVDNMMVGAHLGMCWVVIDEGSRAPKGRFAGSIGLFCLPHETPRMQKTHGWKAMAKVETGYGVVGACGGGVPVPMDPVVRLYQRSRARQRRCCGRSGTVS